MVWTLILQFEPEGVISKRTKAALAGASPIALLVLADEVIE